ncbi:MAG: PAS domain-containing protein, partial [Acidimicrobiia bacterium]
MTAIADEGMIIRSLYELVAEDSPDLHTVTTVDGVYRFVSSVSYALFGWEPIDLVGRNQASFLHPDDIGLVERARLLALKNPSGPVTSIARFRCAGGAYRWTEA